MGVKSQKLKPWSAHGILNSFLLLLEVKSIMCEFIQWVILLFSYSILAPKSCETILHGWKYEVEKKTWKGVLMEIMVNCGFVWILWTSWKCYWKLNDLLVWWKLFWFFEEWFRLRSFCLKVKCVLHIKSYIYILCENVQKKYFQVGTHFMGKIINSQRVIYNLLIICMN